MKIKDILNEKEVTLSFEVFPPKNTNNYESVTTRAKQVASLKPDFMSVTYGAGGGTSAYTGQIAHDIKEEYGVDVLAHLTCVSSTKEYVHEVLDKFKELGIENIMALRGDIPEGGSPYNDYHHAYELIKEIKETGDFCIGAACYPEGHTEAENKKEDILHLKEKVDAGVDFLTTQMFFDNNVYYNFLYRAREVGIDVPIIAGIMPITNKNQVKRAIELSGCSMPQKFINLVDEFGDNPEAMKQAGIIYASNQIIDLISNGVKHIHVYTMNNKEVAEGIMNNISEMIK